MLIRPPPEIRAVCDRTALFVAKNGRTFETRILNSDKGKTAKFAFLHGTSPFHAYYEDRVKFYASGGTDDETKEQRGREDGGGERVHRKKDGRSQGEDGGRPKDADNEEKEKTLEATARKKRASVIPPVARILLAERARISNARASIDVSPASGANGDSEKTGVDANTENSEREAANTSPPPPSPLRFTTLTAPSSLTSCEIDTIKVTAQYAAMAGKSSTFLKDLTYKEWTNPTFEFLQPRSPTFSYFTALVDIYRRLLAQDMQHLEGRGGGQSSAGDSKGGLVLSSAVRERYVHSVLGDSNQKNKKATNTDGQDESKTSEGVLDAATSILAASDSHGRREAALLIAAYRIEYERDIEERQQSRQAELAGDAAGLSASSTIDWHDFIVVETVVFSVDEIVEAAPPPPPDLLTTANATKRQEDGKAAGSDGAMEESDDDEDMLDIQEGDDEKIDVVPKYQPKVVSATAASSQDRSKTHVVDPISGKSIPLGDLSEHMRIQLLDPKWAEEKRAHLEKQRESNIVGGDAIAENIGAFAKEKGNLFGSSERELLDREAGSKERLAKANQLIREQATSGAALPSPPAAMSHPRPGGTDVPGAKRARLNTSTPLPLPPPPPPPPFASAEPLPLPPPPPPDPQIPASVININDGQPPASVININDGQPPSRVPQLAPPADDILPAQEFLASVTNPEATVVTVQVPKDPSSKWNFDGRAISVTVDITTATIKLLKESLRSELGDMPVNRIQLRLPGGGFLKDKDDLASLNIGPGSTLNLVQKTRGGGGRK